ncbi:MULTISPECIES: hypothetical protein [Psychrobacter]|uniref:hypothetical protein n=1 Tax=Psychrobacter TaxID=497 RepID=UPI00186925AD|nr:MULTISPECIES: hypothetical protein [Psychrobacter]
MPHSLSPVTRNPQIQADFYTQLIISELAQTIAHTNVRLTAIYAEAIALQVPLTDTKKTSAQSLEQTFFITLHCARCLSSRLE